MQCKVLQGKKLGKLKMITLAIDIPFSLWLAKVCYTDQTLRTRTYINLEQIRDFKSSVLDNGFIDITT